MVVCAKRGMTMSDSAWDDAKQQRFNALRTREEAGVLTPAEQAELDGLLTLLDDLEWQQLQPALERMEQEQAATIAALARLEATRDDLTEVASRQRQLLIRARAQLLELLAAHRALQADYRRLNIDAPTA
jgi:hypothetical protein